MLVLTGVEHAIALDLGSMPPQIRKWHSLLLPREHIGNWRVCLCIGRGSQLVPQLSAKQPNRRFDSHLRLLQLTSAPVGLLTSNRIV